MLDITTKATISAATNLKLGKGEDGIPAISLTMKSTMDSAQAAMLLGNEKASEALSALFWNTDGRDVMPFIGAIKAVYTASDCTVYIGERDSLDGADNRQVFRGVKFSAKEVIATDKPDIWNGKFSVMFTDPDADALHDFVAALKGEMKIQIVGGTENALEEAPDQLFDEEQQEQFEKTDGAIMSDAKDQFNKSDGFEDFVADAMTDDDTPVATEGEEF